MCFYCMRKNENDIVSELRTQVWADLGVPWGVGLERFGVLGELGALESLFHNSENSHAHKTSPKFEKTLKILKKETVFRKKRKRNFLKHENL